MKNTIFTTIVAVLALAVAGYALYATSKPEGDSPSLGAQSQQLTQGNCIVGPDGGATCSTAKNFNTASTTVCAIQAPTNASSTLGKAVLRFDVGTTSDTIVTVAKGTTQFATTTLLGNQISFLANTEDVVVASTTAAQQKAEADVFAPGEWLVVGMQSNSANAIGHYSPRGSCSAQFIY